MENLYRKLNNSDGKTILMVLFLLLVAIAVSVIIITAATTAAHQINDNRQAQQAYLTASSAAQLFRDEIAGETYTHTETVTIWRRGNILSGSESSYSESSPNGSFKALLGDVAAGIKNGSLPNATGAYKETTAGISGFDNVDVTIYINSAASGTTTESNKTYSYYNMNIAFEVKGDKDKQGYKLNLNIPIEMTNSKPKDNEYSGYDIGKGYRYITVTTTTVTFGKGTITREGLGNINEVTTNE